MRKTKINIINSDVLIIGSGIAGLRAALEVSRKGKRPLLISKSPMGKSNNSCLSGGTFTFSTERWGSDKHLEKTLESGRMLNDHPLVKTFIAHAPSMVRELLEMGMLASMRKSGVSCRGPKLIGGPEITSTLVQRCSDAGIQCMEGIMVTDLVVSDGECHGALGFHKRTGEVYGFRSPSILLATGGAGAIYAQHDNAPGAVGDGYILAMRAGLELIDMEFVQYYPLVFVGSRNSNMTIPGSFADVGKIRNRLGEDLKEKYNLHQKPIASVSRDQLSQALFKEIAQGNGVNGAIILDMRGEDEPLMDFRDLSGESEEVFKRKLSYDLHPIRITPASHYTMGGIRIDRFGKTALDGLFAAGEVVGGVHGANRMGGNALSESLVFGALGARSAVEYAGSRQPSPDFEGLANIAAQKRFSGMMGECQKSSSVQLLMGELRNILWEKIGIVRNERSLKEGIEGIDGILQELNEQSSSIPREFCRIIQSTNAALTGKAIALSALRREESRGSHYREDFPQEDENWLTHIHIKMVEDVPQVSRMVSIHDFQ